MPDGTRSRPGAILTLGDDGEVDRANREPVGAEQIGEVTEFVEGQIGGAPAFLADQVVMLSLIHQVDHSGTVPEMHVTKVASLFEHLDYPVDRRWVHSGPGKGLYFLVQIRRSQVIVMRLS
jgi:hypothetical protein